MSSPPFPLSVLSFLPQILQKHLLASDLKHGPQNSQEMGEQSLSHPQRKAAGEEEGAPVCLWGRGVSRALMPSPTTGQGPSFTELAPRRLPNTDMNLPQPPWPLLLVPPPPSPCGPAPHRAAPQLTWRLCHTDPSLGLFEGSVCPGTRPFRCLPTTHPARFPREQEPSLPSPTHLLTLLRLCTRSWRRVRGGGGAGLVGTGGWQAGSWLGRWCLLRPQAAWAWSGGGGEGRGRVQPAVFSHPAHSQAAGSAFSLLTASGP